MRTPRRKKAIQARVVDEAPPIGGDNYYISASTGDDSRTETQAKNIATPWQTIGKAMTSGLGGNTAYVRAGSYPSVSATGSGPGRVSHLTISPYPGETPTLTGSMNIGNAMRWVTLDGLSWPNGGFSTGTSGTATTADIVVRNALMKSVSLRHGTRRVTFENFEIDSQTYASQAFLLAQGSSVSACTDITLRNGSVHTCGEGIHLNLFQNFLCENVDVYDVRDDPNDPLDHPDAIQTVWGGTGLTFRNCSIYDYEAQGLFLTGAVMNDVRVENCVIGPADGPYVEADIQDSDNVVWINNTIAGVLRTQSSGTNCIFYNNIVDVVTSSNSTYAQMNAVGYNLIRSGRPASWAGPGDITGSPTYVNPGADDYRITAGSLGVDDGIATLGGEPAPSTDRDGIVRGNPPEIGAYQAV